MFNVVYGCLKRRKMLRLYDSGRKYDIVETQGLASVQDRRNELRLYDRYVFVLFSCRLYV